MRICLLITFLLISISFGFSYFEKDMKYHHQPSFYFNSFVNDAFACYFKLSDFGISGYDYKINIIGFIGYLADGQADIYVTSKEEWDGKKYVPVCSPNNNWQGSEYGPKSWHINNSYPNYDDCYLFDDNWHYSKDIDKFWCMYYIKSPTPHPQSDIYDKTVNSLTYGYPSNKWGKGTYGAYCDWCMHCVIVYWGADIENTSLGTVKTLFR